MRPRFDVLWITWRQKGVEIVWYGDVMSDDGLTSGWDSWSDKAGRDITSNLLSRDGGGHSGGSVKEHNYPGALAGLSGSTESSSNFCLRPAA
jgi:hypothetical protein